MPRLKIAKKVTDLTARKVDIEFTNDHVVTMTLKSLEKDIVTNLALHGLSQKLGDSYAGAESVDEAIERCTTIAERLQQGEWIKPRESAGPRPSMVVDAVVAALVANGEEVDDTRRAAIAEKTKGKEGRERALANPAIRAQYETIRATRAAKRAAKAQGDAEGATLEGF